MKRRRRWLRRWLGIAFATAAALAVAAPAAAESTVRIRDASLETDGTVELTVSVGDAATTLTGADFAVTESGVPVEGFAVEPLRTETPVAVALAVDVSGSTAGRPLADAKTAAQSFLEALPGGARIAVVAFSDTAWIRTNPTTDRAAAAEGIASLRAGGGTALYEGVALAARTIANEPGQRTIVVFSDGKDTASAITLAGAITAARQASASVTAVALVTADTDRTALQHFAEDTRGRLLEVGESNQLSSAFASVASEIASQYVVTYRATGGPAELEIAVTVAGARDAILISNPRDATPAAPAPAPAGPKPPVGALSGSAGLAVGLAAAFGFVALFGGLLLWRVSPSAGGRTLRRSLSALQRPRETEPEDDEDEEGGARAEFGRAAERAIHRLPAMGRIEDQLQNMLERAGWPMRAGEFLATQAAAGVAGLAAAWALTGRWWMGLLAGAATGAVPRLILSRKIASREAAFMQQLPETLTLMAGTLKAGYGFMQAVDVLVRETPQPTSGEFSRVLTEVRLGMPIEESLTLMAERTGSEDFRWVVLAMIIQRQVGGNLAELLTTVAKTLREREQVRRQIKVLSAEGRLSAIILGALPFVIAGYISVVNPGYLTGLFGSATGKMMIAAALGLMGLGLAWIRKIIRIDV